MNYILPKDERNVTKYKLPDQIKLKVAIRSDDENLNGIESFFDQAVYEQQRPKFMEIFEVAEEGMP